MKFPFLKHKNHFCAVLSLTAPSPYTTHMSQGAFIALELLLKAKRTVVENANFYLLGIVSQFAPKEVKFNKISKQVNN